MRPGRAADHLPLSSAAVMQEQSYTSTHLLGHTGPVTGSLYLYLLHQNSSFKFFCLMGVISLHKLFTSYDPDATI